MGLERAERLTQSSMLSHWMTRNMVPPEEVAAALLDAGVEFVLVGAHAIAGYTQRPRATVDVDVVVLGKHNRRALKAIRAAFPHLVPHDGKVVTRFADPQSGDIYIDVTKPKDALLKTLFDHTVSVQLGSRKVRIPDLEAAAALKFAAMVGVDRKRADKEQDGVDFRRIVEANAGLDTKRLAALAELVYAGGGAEVRRLVAAVRKGEPLVF